MKVTIYKEYKSIPKGLVFELPDFCVLTGRNGSGKSHLLEAMANRQHTVIEDEEIVSNVLHVGYNGLNPNVTEACDSSELVNGANAWWGQVNTLIMRYMNSGIDRGGIVDVVEQYVVPNHGNNPALVSVVRKVLDRTGKRLENITQDDVYRSISFTEEGGGSIFFSQCAKIFKAYHVRLINNQFDEFRVVTGKAQGLHFLSDEEFVKKYGPPPWDLINDVLNRAGLPYECSDPQQGDVSLAYQLKLVDKVTGVNISVNDLSSGEKVLMSLALAIYNTHEGGNRPKVLLLDEPDAPLHPHFSKLLIDTVVETLVKGAGVKVVMTTHSPATVAMAPDSSVYEVSRDNKAPVMVSNSKAVSVLTEGINFLRVSYESRRQIFVESKYDVGYFEALFNVLNRKYKYGYEPIFMEPHSGTSNCSDVMNIVERLEQAGSDLVRGVVDYDGVNLQKDKIFVLGSGNRYAIENYILDPLYVSLALVRCGKKSYQDFGLGGGRDSYLDVLKLESFECQTMVDNFLAQIGIGLSDLLDVTLENDFVIKYPKGFLMKNGHEYEEVIQKAFPELQFISRGKGDAALKKGIIEVISEVPQFLPVEVGRLFSILA